MLSIRPAKQSDVRRLSYLIRNNIERVKDNHFSPIQHATWSAQNKPKAIEERRKTRNIFCAFEHHKMVGTIALKENLLCGMYVSYSQRGKGIGQKLIHYLENYAQKKGIEELILTASPNGYGFYLKNGYRAYGPVTIVFEGIEFPETKMKKKLV